MTQLETNIKESAKARLLEQIKPGDTIYCVLRHVSQSGMYRVIDLYVIKNNKPHCISYLAAQVMGYKLTKKYEAIGISGCGMDMGFALVYELGKALFPDGFKLSADNHARNGDTSGYDKDGGYALNREWL